MKSYDILIDSEPYLFGNKGGIALGSSLMEPGSPREVATIVIPSAHHGYGQMVNRDPEKAETLDALEVGEGFIMPAGNEHASSPNTITDAFWTGAITGSQYTPDTNFHARPVGSLFVPDTGKFFIIFPRKIIEFDPNSYGAVTRLTAPVSGGDFFAYTGAVARWRNQYVFGIESTGVAIAPPGDDSQRQGEFWASYTTYTDVFANQTADAIDMSHVVTTANKAVRIDNIGRNFPPALYVADDPTSDFGSLTWIGPIHIPGGGYCTGMYLLGPHVVLAKSTGQLMGMDTGEVFSPLVNTEHSRYDDFFGANARHWLNYFIIPSSVNILRLDPSTLQLVPFDPPSVQGHNMISAMDSPARQFCVATRGTEELYVFGNDSSTTAATTLFLVKGRLYPDGKFAYTSQRQLTTTFPSHARHITVVRGHPSVNGRDVIVMVSQDVSSPANAHIHVVYEYPYSLNYSVMSAYATNPMYVSSRVSADGVAAGLTIKPLQVRLWRDTDEMPAGGTNRWTVMISIEDGTFVSIGTIAPGTGQVTFPIPSTTPDLGRYFQIKIVGSVLDGTVHQHIAFPIAIDYAFVPNTKDAIVIKVEATSEQINKLGGEWTRDSGRSITDRLIDLRGLVKTVEFTDGSQWSVLIEDVGAAMVANEEPRTNSPTWLVTLDCRRL